MHSLPLEALQLLMDQLPESPFFVKDRELRYVAANGAMARLCGTAPGAMLGRRAGDFFPEPLARHYEALDRQVLASGRPLTNQLERSAMRAGSVQWLIYARTPIVDASGEPVGVAGVSRRLRQPDRRHPTYERVSRAMAALRTACDRPLELLAIARDSGVSVSQLERDFAQILELTPRDIHTMARIDRALELLGRGMTVARVAQECGFADHSAFTRRFRALVGRTPVEYARQARRTGDTASTARSPGFARSGTVSSRKS